MKDSQGRKLYKYTINNVEVYMIIEASQILVLNRNLSVVCKE